MNWQTQTLYSSSPLSLSVTFLVNSSAVNPASETPYSTTDSCNFVTLRKNGVSKSGSLPYGPFQSNSPIRPFCFSIQATSSETNSNDFIVSSLQPTLITLSSYVIIDPAVLPAGFVPFNFTASSSTNGQMHQGLYLETSPSLPGNIISLTLPQISVANNIGPQSVDTIGVLRYDPNTAIMSFLQPAEWSQDIASPLALRLKVKLPGQGYYLFGVRKPREFVPIASNTWVDYSDKFGQLNTILDGGKLQLSFEASAATRFAVMKPPRLNWMPDGYNIIDTFIFTGDYLADQSIVTAATLVYKSTSENIYWGYL
jgi:hypothetical protein